VGQDFLKIGKKYFVKGFFHLYLHPPTSTKVP